MARRGIGGRECVSLVPVPRELRCSQRFWVGISDNIHADFLILFDTVNRAKEGQSGDVRKMAPDAREPA
jgi:hypothetical protein